MTQDCPVHQNMKMSLYRKQIQIYDLRQTYVQLLGLHVNISNMHGDMRHFCIANV